MEWLEYVLNVQQNKKRNFSLAKLYNACVLKKQTVKFQLSQRPKLLPIGKLLQWRGTLNPLPSRKLLESSFLTKEMNVLLKASGRLSRIREKPHALLPVFFLFRSQLGVRHTLTRYPQVCHNLSVLDHPFHPPCSPKRLSSSRFHSFRRQLFACRQLMSMT